MSSYSSRSTSAFSSSFFGFFTHARLPRPSHPVFQSEAFRAASVDGFFLSIKVSYPNEQDIRRAHTRHWDTGGSIMIHGLPNILKHEQEYYESHDWTDGCVAVSNADMVEIWMLVPDDVPIDILP